MATLERRLAIVLALLALTTTVPAATAVDAREGEVLDRVEDEEGRPLAETRTVPGEERVRVTETWAYPGQGAAVSMDDGDGVGFPVLRQPATDCSSDDHATWGFRWLAPYHAFTNAHATLLAEAGTTWNLQTGGQPFGAVVEGEVGEPRTRDDVNQIVFDDFGGTDWLAQAWIWWHILPGVEGDTLVALESDQRYNVGYPLDPDPSGGQFDLLGLATHEMGHTLGLQHGSGGCLTMYPYFAPGSTQERTLGDGDVLGIRGLYGPLPRPG